MIPTDAAARERALDPHASFIVQAPAGSGKTELLVRRYLVLLARVQRPEEVLAITFTIKAAEQMRQRVLQALRDARVGAAAGDVLARPAQAALARDRELGWGLPAQPSRLKIQTIDAFCGALVAQMPWSAGTGGRQSLLEDATALYGHAAGATLAHLERSERRWSAAVAAALEHLDGDMPRLRKLLMEMLGYRDQWLPHVVAAGAAGLRERLDAGWRHRVEQALTDLEPRIDILRGVELAHCARYAARAVDADSPLGACANLDEPPRVQASDLQQWQGLAELLLTRSGTLRKRAHPATATDPDVKSTMLRLLQALAPHGETLAPALSEIRELPLPRYADAQWQALDALLELLPLAVAELQLLFRRRQQADFGELAQRALLALGEPEAPTDLNLTLDYRIQHVLVDEFQDTSFSQLRLLERLTAGWQPGDGRTLFLVGDPMQSIYRFREAQVGIFLDVARHGLGGIRPGFLRLDTNFRSTASIVRWVNSAIGAVFPRSADMSMGAVCYSEFNAAGGETPGRGGVEVHALVNDDGRAEARAVVELVGHALLDWPDGRVAILVRYRQHLEHIIPALRRAGIAFRGVELERLTHRSVVLDLLSLTRALLHPADRIAWLAVLRAPWCGLTLVDLTHLVGADTRRSVWACVDDSDGNTRISRDGMRRLARVRAALGTARANRQRRSLRRWVEGVWRSLAGPRCVDPTDRANADVFFELLEEHDQGGDVVDFAELERAAGALWALPDTSADHRLEIMTVHKAKGLEFDVVIVPGLGRYGSRGTRRLLEWAEVPGAEATPELLLAPLPEVGSEGDRMFQYLRSLERAKDRLEANRLLYVAATRARYVLHLIGNARTLRDGALADPTADSFLAALWPATRQYFEQAQPMVPAAAGHEAARGADNGLLRRLPADAPPPISATDVDVAPKYRDSVVESPSVSYDWVGMAARHVGTVVHQLLHELALGGLPPAELPDTIERWQTMLRETGVDEPARDWALERVQRAVRNVRGDFRAQWLFDPHHRAVHDEWALTGIADGRLVRGVVDRSFIDSSGTRWIVDYKTSSHEGGELDAFLDREMIRYRGQMDRYARLLAGMEQRPLRIGLYFPLHPAWREWSCSLDSDGAQ